MAENAAKDENPTSLHSAWSTDPTPLPPKSKPSPLSLSNFPSQLSLTSTDPGEDSAELQFKRRFSELSWVEALQVQDLNQRLQEVLAELEKTLPQFELRSLRSKTCAVLLSTAGNSLRLRRSSAKLSTNS